VLNHERYAEEVAAGLHNKGTGKAAGQSRKRMWSRRLVLMPPDPPHLATSSAQLHTGVEKVKVVADKSY
jgi:hypothetical protein